MTNSRIFLYHTNNYFYPFLVGKITENAKL